MAQYNVLSHEDMVIAGTSYYGGSVSPVPEHHAIEAMMTDMTENKMYRFVTVIPAWSDQGPLYVFEATNRATPVMDSEGGF